MKTRLTMVVAMAVLAMQFAQSAEPAKKFRTEEQKIGYATKNLVVALQSTNTGVMESAMRVTAQMKMNHPSADVSALVKALNVIRQKNPSGTVRYKAYLAISICENPEIFTGEKTLASAEDKDFFKTASDRMREQLLSTNTQ